MTADERDKKNRMIVNGKYDINTRHYINLMCKKGCKFYDNGCTKKRVVRVCAKKGLKNKE